ncbi:hypothetical protein HDU76_004923, partial [Blyttiomyces sp. JEL0837]
MAAASSVPINATITLKLTPPGSPTKASPGSSIKGWLNFTVHAPNGIEATGPLAIDIIGLSRVGWNLVPGDPLFGVPGVGGGPDGTRVELDHEFWRQRVDVAPAQIFTKGEHAYQFDFPLPESIIPAFNSIDNEGTLTSVRYLLQAALISTELHPAGVPSPDVLIVTHPLEIIQPKFPFDQLSPLQAAQTSNKVSVRLWGRRDHWEAGKIMTLFVDAKNGAVISGATSPATGSKPPTKIRIFAVELIQRIGLWTYLADGTPLSKNITRVVGRIDLPQLRAGERHEGTTKLVLPASLPPSTSVHGMEVSYEASVVAIVGGSDVMGGGVEVRCGVEVFIETSGREVEIPELPKGSNVESWDEVNEEATAMARAVEAATAEIKKMAMETQAEYEKRVEEARVAAEKAMIEASEKLREQQEEAARRLKEQQEAASKALREHQEMASRVVAEKEKEARLAMETADARIREAEVYAAEKVKASEIEAQRIAKEKEEEAKRIKMETEMEALRIVKEKDEEAKRLVEEKEKETKRLVEEKDKILKETEEETAKRIKAAEKSARAAAAAAAAIRKANAEAMAKIPVLPARKGIEGKILDATGLLPRATLLSIEGTYKDSALYQLFKLYYFDLTREEDEKMKAENLVPGVIVFASAAAGLRVSKEEVPTWLRYQQKEESRSKAPGDQQEYTVRLVQGPGRYYVAVFGNANPLVMTNYTITVRKMPRTLRLSDFQSIWKPIKLKSPIPRDAMVVGRDLDGHPLHAIRVRLSDGSTRIGHMSAHMKAPMIAGPTSGGTLSPLNVTADYEILMGNDIAGLKFVEQLQGGSIPPNAVPAGVEADGQRILYVARAQVQGKSVDVLKRAVMPGETGVHLQGATVVSKGGLGILIAPYEVQRSLVPYESSKTVHMHNVTGVSVVGSVEMTDLRAKVQLAQLSYCDCNICYGIVNQLSDIQNALPKTSQYVAFLAVNNSTKTIYLSFRGATDAGSFFASWDETLVDPKFLNYPEGVKVHGYSYGCIFAAFVAADLVLGNIISGSKVSMTTLGCPRGGNHAWANMIDTTLGLHSLRRIVHSVDSVSHFPSMQNKYRHFRSEYWFSTNEIETLHCENVDPVVVTADVACAKVDPKHPVNATFLKYKTYGRT